MHWLLICKTVHTWSSSKVLALWPNLADELNLAAELQTWQGKSRINGSFDLVRRTDICKLGRNLDEACKLNYIPLCAYASGNYYAKIDNSEIKANVQWWNNTLVGYVPGDKPFYIHLKACVTRLWKPCSLEIHSRENGFFYFRFGTKEECNRVLQTGPWQFDGRLIFFKQWSPDTGLERELLSSVSVKICANKYSHS